MQLRKRNDERKKDEHGGGIDTSRDRESRCTINYKQRKNHFGIYHGQKVMRKENDKWKWPFMINKLCGQPAELVNLQRRIVKNLVESEILKNCNEHSTHTRKEYKEEAKQTREEWALLNVKEEEDLEIQQVMMECYSIKIFMMTMNKKIGGSSRERGILTNGMD